MFKPKVFVDPESVSCSLCRGLAESVSHLFVTYDLMESLWCNILIWLGIHLDLPRELLSLFTLFISLREVSKIRSGISMIWHAIIILLSKSKNDFIFIGTSTTIEDEKKNIFLAC